LSDWEYKVLREKATDPPTMVDNYKPPKMTENYTYHKPKQGYYACRGCLNPLYSYQAKFSSGCGWPAFDKCYENSIKTEVDTTYGMARIEIMCAKCSGHLGHAFLDEGYDKQNKARSNQRHCVNSTSVKYIDKQPPKDVKESTLVIEENSDE